MTLRVLIIGFALWFGLAVNASADIEGSLAVAQTYWGTTACPDSAISAQWVEDPNPDSRDKWLALTEHDSRTLGDPLTFYDCQIRLNAWLRDQGSVWLTDPASLCTILSHEYGHLLGYQHSSEASAADPEDVMNQWPRGVITACSDRFDPTVAAPDPPVIEQPLDPVAMVALARAPADQRLAVMEQIRQWALGTQPSRRHSHPPRKRRRCST